MIEEGALLRLPTRKAIRQSGLNQYMEWLAANGRHFADFGELWQWSVTEIDEFWRSQWDYFDLLASGDPEPVREGVSIQATRWFPRARLNFCEHILRAADFGDPHRPAIHHASELRPLTQLSWTDLSEQVRTLATSMRELGIQPGDRIASIMPNISETAVAMLATVAIGAVWSSVAPEFGAKSIQSRIGQLEPKMLFATDGYRYAGTDHSMDETVRVLCEGLPSLRHVVTLQYLDPGATVDPHGRAINWSRLFAREPVAAAAFEFARVGPEHPLWVLFTSGTTGLPKAIVHGHTGITLEYCKGHRFSTEVGPASTVYSFSTTSWVVWNTLIGCMITGAAIVLYDGQPLFPNAKRFWQLVEDSGTTVLGLSPAMIMRMQAEGCKPNEHHDLSAVEHILLSGSPAAPDIYTWCYDHVSSDCWVASQAGSTEVAGAIAGGVVLLPVRAGEIQSRALGLAVESVDDDGCPLVDERGELVISKPFPSMPLGLWGDDGGGFHEAYFSQFDGRWCQGDIVKLNAHGGLYIYGRSDATLNRDGVRIGTAEIYNALDAIPEVIDAIAVCVDRNNRSELLLFVKLADGRGVAAELRSRIEKELRKKASPRHVPDEIWAVPAIPYTKTGKRLEVPLRRILSGESPTAVVDPATMADPSAMQAFTQFANMVAPSPLAPCATA